MSMSFKIINYRKIAELTVHEQDARGPGNTRQSSKGQFNYAGDIPLDLEVIAKDFYL